MRRLVMLGVLLIAAGIVAAVVIAVPPLEVKGQIESFPKTRLSEGAVELEAREYDVYLDVPSGTGEAGWTLSVRDPHEHAVELRPAGANREYERFGRETSRIGRMRVTTAGRHVVRGTGPPGADVVFADDVLGDMRRSLLFALAAFALLSIAGVVLIVVGIARRAPRKPKRSP